jgi:xanthine dehydrogenase YagS FAD-binding subunit
MAGGGLEIGALTTITEVAENPVIRKRYAGLAKGAAEVASPQLRNQGTIGGNLCQKPRCWYYRGDFAL